MSVTINLNNVQATLVNETNIKSLNGTTILGSGQITVDKAFVGLGNVDNTSDVNKPISTATQTALNGKENTITAGTTGQYYRGDKTFQTLDKSAVGLGNVANVDQQNADNITSGTLSGARLPNPTTTVLGGVKRNIGTAGQFVTGISASGDLEYSIPSGGGDVTGAASSVNNNIAVFDGTTGKIIKDGGETIASINNSISGKQDILSEGAFVNGDKTKLDGIQAGAQVNTVTSVASKTGAVTLDKNDVGLGNVDNTSDVNKPISTATQTALNGKENTITAGTTGQYFRGDKTFQNLNATAVGLGNVANVDQQNADNITSGTLSGARLPNPQTTVLGGVKRNTGSAGQFVSGINASGDLEYSTPTGGGDVTGAASSVNNNIAVFDGTTGKIIKDGGETIASINNSISAKEDAIAAGTTGQYFRGDKTFQTLDKSAVGLGNVDNTSDLNKPISTATQTALDAKEGTITATTSADYYRGDKTFQPLNATAVGLGNVANVDQQNADNITSGTLSGARLPNPTTTVLGGVKRNTGTAGQFVNGIDTSGNLQYGTPAGGGSVDELQIVLLTQVFS